jgi:hypothetical protein
MVGLIPLFAVHVITADTYRRLDNFRRRTEWFLDRNPHLAQAMVGRLDGRHVLCAVTPERLERILAHLFDESKFFSPFGPRSLSKEHEAEPVVLWQGDRQFSVGYEPGESITRMKGGNSNWRGPIWFPVNVLLVESLQRFDYFYRDDFKVACPTGSEGVMPLREVAAELERRLIRIFRRGPDGRRPVLGAVEKFQTDPRWRDLIPFHEYFNGDTGAGVGASHQTGWTALVGKFLLQIGEGAAR